MRDDGSSSSITASAHAGFAHADFEARVGFGILGRDSMMIMAEIMISSIHHSSAPCLKPVSEQEPVALKKR